MADAQQALLALPPPRATAPAVFGLRASLRGAAAMPVDPVQPSKAAHDATFGTSVHQLGRDGSDESAAGFQHHSVRRLGSALDWIQARFSADQSVPFLAQQLGQHARPVVPTLEANAEVAAYAATQQRADQAALAHESLLDLRA